jgi:hypothetical protein
MVAITRRHHPAEGKTFVVVRGGPNQLVIRLDDDSTMRIPRSWTDADGPCERTDAPERVFTIDALRELGALVVSLARRCSAKVEDASTEVNDADYALHWSGLHEGVRHASKIRVQEIEEDLRWAHEAMTHLKDLVVPCTKAKLLSVWKRAKLIEQASPGLPDDYEAVLDELKRAGILRSLADGRINIPDVYRLGFGLRRKGGFAPRRS